MKLLNQTRIAFGRIPTLFKNIFFVWYTVPFGFIFLNLESYKLFDVTYAILFTLSWILGTLVITLSSVFQRKNKKALNEYAKENSHSKINGQTFAAAMQSNHAYNHLVKMLPPHLANDLGLYVAARWGRITKIIMISMAIFYFCIMLLAPQFLK